MSNVTANVRAAAETVSKRAASLALINNIIFSLTVLGTLLLLVQALDTGVAECQTETDIFGFESEAICEAAQAVNIVWVSAIIVSFLVALWIFSLVRAYVARLHLTVISTLEPTSSTNN